MEGVPGRVFGDPQPYRQPRKHWRQRSTLSAHGSTTSMPGTGIYFGRSNPMAARRPEAIWTQGDDPSRMMRYLLRHPPLDPTSRKTALLGAACARLAWAQIDTDKVRQLIECQEK